MKWVNFIREYLIEKEVGVHPKEVGFFDACVKRMAGKVDDPEAYCASIKDRAWGSTLWRGKGKTRKEIEKQIKARE